MMRSHLSSCQRKLASILPKNWMPAFAGMTLLLLTIPAHSALAKSYGERTQETIAVGEGRFLIFVGASIENKTKGYTVDMIKVEDGVPYYLPLFIEDYDPESNTAKLGYGVAFEATDYHYNKTEHTLNITQPSPDNTERYTLNYSLDNDILHLQTVTAQPIKCSSAACKPKQKYKKK